MKQGKTNLKRATKQNGNKYYREEKEGNLVNHFDDVGPTHM